MTPLQQFQHLMAMAAADERINEAELGFLSERAAALGISPDEFHDALQVAVSGDSALAMPASPAERRALLKDLVMMMAADGQLADREKDLFAHVAATMEVETAELHRIIDATIAENS